MQCFRSVEPWVHEFCNGGGLMARKSRKQEQVILLEKYQSEQPAGIYVRLSVEDNGYENSDSMKYQMIILEEYVKVKEGIYLASRYIDNGSTGTNFDRQAWNEMLEDLKNKKITCIVVKDFSRLGRNYIEVGDYLEKVFPFLGVRVISVNDNYDSFVDRYNESMIKNSLLNVMNEYYARDISKKISKAKNVLQKDGKFISPIIPYGYQRNPMDKHKLVIDKESADVVKKIYQWRVSGKGCIRIANLLNELLIPSPGYYKYINGDKRFERSAQVKWKSKHVVAILTNPLYLGHMTQGKTHSSYFSYKPMVFLPQAEWIIVKNTHEH